MTIEANRELEAMAAQIRADPFLTDLFASHEASEVLAALERQPEARAFLTDFRAFLERYGHREMVLSTALQPTWKDAPETVLGILKGFAAAPPRSRDGRPAWEVARNEMLSHPLMCLAPFRAMTLGLLKTARCLWLIREDTHFNATLILPILRRALLEMGERLVSVGVLEACEDVFHLRFDELEGIGGRWPPPADHTAHLRQLVLKREQWRAAFEGTPIVDPRLYQRTVTEGDALLHGTPGSPGSAEGPVRVMREVSDFHKLGPGEVLVAPYTNPAWTPLFQRAVAVIVDSGGAGSHAAIVAREYGIPAVMGTADATRRLTDGQQVRVDGWQGLVFNATLPGRVEASA
jgi:pyruvate,water dikinase